MRLKMRIPRKDVPCVIHEEREDTCVNCKTAIVLSIMSVVFSILLIGGGTGLIVAFTGRLRSCTNHEDCTTKNPCTEDRCDQLVCVSDKIDGCCIEDQDCGASTCYNSFCDNTLFTCRLSPPLNGTLCNDYNECTVNDRCSGYKCVGQRLTCDTGSSCSSGICVKGTGCVFTAALDATACDDNNKCTVADMCWRGMCASGTQKSCSHYDSACSLGVCDTLTGDCISVPRNERDACDDQLICTKQDQCIEGVCRGEIDKCWDNNPCTVNKCVEGIGCMLKYEDYNMTCSTTCCGGDCPDGYLCADGTCVQMGTTNAQIRFIDYEIEICAAGGHRLVMDYVLDSDPYTIGNDTRYIIPKTLSDIGAQTGQNLGFMDEKRNLQNAIIGEFVRSAFILTTACQIVTQENCDSIFAMRTYAFYVELHHCLSVSPNEPNCLDFNIQVAATIDLSISDCTQFTQYQHIPIYGVGVLYADGQRYTGIVQNMLGGLNQITVGYESPAYPNPSIMTMTKKFRICRVDVNHYLKDCVRGSDPNCINTGCFGWDPSNTPIIEYHDIVADGYVTTMAKTLWSTVSCYNENNYNAPSSVRCSENKCPNTTNGAGWVAPMDDGFRFSTTPLQTNGTTKEWTFDILFGIYFCNATRRLRTSHTDYHNTVTLVI